MSIGAKNEPANPVTEIPVPAPTKKKKERKLSLRERRLIKNLQDPGYKTMKDAMIAAGYAASTADKNPGLVIGKSRGKEAITEIMDRQGITDARLVEVLSQGLESTKVISAMVIAPSGEEMKDASGMTKDFIDVPDFMARHKYVETGLKLRGHLQTNVKIDGNLLVETYEMRRKRLGLDDMSPREAHAKFRREHPELGELK